MQTRGQDHRKHWNDQSFQARHPSRRHNVESEYSMRFFAIKARFKIVTNGCPMIR